MVLSEAVDVAAGKALKIMFNNWNRIRLLVVAVFALSLAACGTGGSGEDDNDGVASLGTHTTAASEDSPDTSGDFEAPTDLNEALVLYDQCMAEEGFPTDSTNEVSETATVERGVAGGSDEGSGEGEGPTQRAFGPGGVEIAPEDIEEFEAANDVCGAHLANIDRGEEFTPEQQAALDDANLRVQQCLDDKGVDAQIHFGGGDDRAFVESDESDDDAPPANQGELDQEELDAAMEECMAILSEYSELADVLPPPPGS